MSVQRNAEAVWIGDLLKGSGTVKIGTGALPEFPVSWAARTESPGGKTSPEEMLAAAHASCYAMSFSSTLAKRGTPPQKLDVTATCTFAKVETGWKVVRMDLHVSGKVTGVNQAQFEEAAQVAEKGCPISNAIRNNVEVNVNAQLE